MLMPSSDLAQRNMLAGHAHMATHANADDRDFANLGITGHKVLSRLSLGKHFGFLSKSGLRSVRKSLRWTVKLKSVLPSLEMF